MTITEFYKIGSAAEDYIELGQLEEAAKLLAELPPQAKVSKEVISLHMSMLVKSGELLKASYLAENFCFGDPENTDLMLKVGQLKFGAGEFTEAIKWLRSIEAKCQSIAAFHLLRARCHAALGDLPACILALREAHKLDPALSLETNEDPALEAIFGAECSGMNAT